MSKLDNKRMPRQYLRSMLGGLDPSSMLGSIDPSSVLGGIDPSSMLGGIDPSNKEMQIKCKK